MSCSICRYLVVNGKGLPAQQWCSKYKMSCYDVTECDLGGSYEL